MKKIIVLILIPLILLFSYLFYKDNSKIAESDKIECTVDSKTVIVNGYSMYPFLDSGKEITALYGYYDCNSVSRNDIVLYAYSGNKNLLIKFIRAVPGDRWNLKEVDGNYEIAVNDISIVNSEGKKYSIQESSVKMLELYIKDYPVIPENTYLLLGDQISGSMDSTRFGLVGKKEIMAKIEIK